jgi:hypothetical protein
MTLPGASSRQGDKNLGTAAFVPRFFSPSLTSAPRPGQYHSAEILEVAMQLEKCQLLILLVVLRNTEIVSIAGAHL